MTYPYGASGAPAVGKGLPGLPRRKSAVALPFGEMVFMRPGTYVITVPDGVYQMAVVVVGAGANTVEVDGGSNFGNHLCGGGGGALAWGNVPVTPGEKITIFVGGPSTSDAARCSYFRNLTTVAAEGGWPGTSVLDAGASYGRLVKSRGGVVLAGQGGGNGGAGGYVQLNWNDSTVHGIVTGGGAGGYSGNGGDGVGALISSASAITGKPGAGGAGASGSLSYLSFWGSGGVGLHGIGNSGVATAYGPGQAGSGGVDGYPGTGSSSSGYSGIRGTPGSFGAGAGGSDSISNFGAPGAVRIVFGPGVAFPSTNVGLPY